MADIKGIKKTATDFAQKLSGGDVVLLFGDLGAGKTTFTGFLVEALGGTEAVSSPTYVIATEYILENINIIHADLYRLGAITQDDVMMQDLLKPHDNEIAIIEWADKLPHALRPLNAWYIYLQHGKTEDERTVEIQRKE